jgi:hypothetical protein
MKEEGPSCRGCHRVAGDDSSWWLKTFLSFFMQKTQHRQNSKSQQLMTVRPHQTCCNLSVSIIINRLGSHCSNVLALTGTFTDGTKLAPYLIISIFSYPKNNKKRISCLLTTLMILVWRFSCLIPTLTSFFKLIVQLFSTLLLTIKIMLLYRSLDLMEESLNVLFDKHVHYHKETKFSISPKLKSKVLKKAIFWENSRIHSKNQKKIKNKKK